MGIRLHIQIFCTAYIIIFGFLQVQPLFIKYDTNKVQTAVESKEQACTKTKTATCKRNKCSLPVSSGEKEDCNNNGCNPFVPCNMGFCCFLVENAFAYSVHSLTSQKIYFHFDDNRLQNNLSECWHPPEILS